MKKILSFCLMLFAIGLTAQEQLPNASFENWSTSSFTTQEPTGYFSLNPLATTLTKTTDAYDGTYALKFVSAAVDGTSFGLPKDTVSSLTLGSLSLTLVGMTPQLSMTPGYPFTSRPSNFSFYFKFEQGATPVGMSDSAVVVVEFRKSGSPIGTGIAMYSGDLPNLTSYTKAEAPIVWTSQETPDSVRVLMQTHAVGEKKKAIGTTVYIDKFEFIYNQSSIHEQEAQNLDIYPTAVKNEININTANKFTDYYILNASGNIVKKAKLNSNTISVSTLPQGVYILLAKNKAQSAIARFIKK